MMNTSLYERNIVSGNGRSERLNEVRISSFSLYDHFYTIETTTFILKRKVRSWNHRRSI